MREPEEVEDREAEVAVARVAAAEVAKASGVPRETNMPQLCVAPTENGTPARRPTTEAITAYVKPPALSILGWWPA
jgi:hypothetical protein